MAKLSNRRVLAGMAAVLACALATHAQDPAGSADRPAGNVNELTLAALRPGVATLASAQRRFGSHGTHPSPDEKDLSIWCDAHQHLQLSLEANQQGTVQVVMVERPKPQSACSATLPASTPGTGRGLKLGDGIARAKLIYGKPFFEGPSLWQGRDVHLVVFNFSWAGSDKPQILECSFLDGRLVKLTLSAAYY